MFDVLKEAIGRLAAALLLAAWTLIAVAAPARAADPAPGEFVGKSRNAILIDATSGAVLYQKNADELVAPASTSKLMTLAVLFKAMKSGQLKASDEFLMSVNAWRRGGAPSGTSAMSSTNTTPSSSKRDTTRRLWTISW